MTSETNNGGKWTEQKLFNRAAKHMLFSTRWTKGKFVDSKGNTCAMGACLSANAKRIAAKAVKLGLSAVSDEEYQVYVAELSEMRKVAPKVFNKIVNINDLAKRSRFGQKLRALAKKNNLKVPEFLLKENLGR